MEKEQIEQIIKYLENLTSMYKFELQTSKPDFEAVELATKITFNKINDITHGTAIKK